MEKIGQLNNYSDLNKMPILRRNNRFFQKNAAKLETKSESPSTICEIQI